jgi:inhibitor of cysteine peptidase
MLKRFGQFTMDKGAIALLLVAVVLAAVSGCAAKSALALEAKDNGRQIELEKGQTLAISLEGNPSTGYTWEMVESEGSILRQVGEIEFKAESDLVGAPGTQTLRFEAVESGQTELELVYHRPWEKDVEPLETFTLQVTVR